jgi:hypothetical protein
VLCCLLPLVAYPLLIQPGNEPGRHQVRKTSGELRAIATSHVWVLEF